MNPKKKTNKTEGLRREGAFRRVLEIHMDKIKSLEKECF